MEDLIVYYFNKDFSYEDIKNLLYKKHNIITSVSTIKRKLSDLGLKRKNIEESSLEEIAHAIIQELFSSGLNLGYRSLWKKLKKLYHLKVRRNTVYTILQIFDPDGISDRFGNKLRRREYLSPGPNFIWHLDGYDKLKQFGFAIHACIDGFSRMLMWLEVANTNNNPRVVAYYFLHALKQQKLMPRIVRSDKGSENTLIEDLQITLRSQHDDRLQGEKSYIKGKSVHNQRIESYWGQLRKHTANFYIQLFKDMEKRNLFDGSSFDLMCMQFCFGPLIKADLQLAMELWNEHHIRKQPLRNNLAGKPYIMYNLKENYNARDYKKELNEAAVDRLIDAYTEKPNLINPLMKDFVEEFVPKANFISVTPKEAVEQYKKIRNTKNN